MKRMIALMLVLVMILSGCGTADNTDATSKKGADGNGSKVTAEDRTHKEEKKENLLAAVTEYNAEDSPTGNRYYGYNEYGEVMFSIYETDESDYVDQFCLYHDDNSKEQYLFSQMEASKPMNLSKIVFDSEGKYLKRTDYNYWPSGMADVELDDSGKPVVNEGIVYASSQGEYDYRYTSDNVVQLVWTKEDFAMSETEYNEQGQPLRFRRASSATKLFTFLEYEYDEYGNETKIITYDSDGNVTGTTCTEYDLNEYGKPKSSVVTKNGEIIGSSLYGFYDSETFEAEKNYADPALTGYWVGEKDDREVFLVFTFNGLVCWGFIDPETDIYMIEYYGQRYPEKDGKVECDWRDNGRSYLDDHLSNDFPEYFSYEVNDNELIFDGVTYEKID